MSRITLKHYNPPGLYSAVPAELARSGEISVYAKAVALYIWSHNDGFSVSARSIAQAINIDRGRVMRSLAELQEHGWLYREVYTKPGNTRPSWERWHVQRANRPFAEGEIRTQRVADSDTSPEGTPARGVAGNNTSTGDVLLGTTPTCSPQPHLRVAGNNTIEVQLRSAPEGVHDCSSASTDQIETASYGQSLAAEEEPSQALEPAEDHESPEGSDEWSDLNPPTAADPWSAIGVRSTPLVSDPPIAEPEALDPWGPPPTLGEWSEPKEDVIPWPRDKPLPVDPWSTYVCDQTGEKLSRV